MMRQPAVSQPPCTGSEVVDACYMISSMLSKGAGWVFGIWSTVAARKENKSQLVLGVLSLQQWRLSTPDLDHTLSVSGSSLDYFLFEDRGGQGVLSADVFMPQLAADVPVQRRFGPKERGCRSTCQDSSGGHVFLNSESRRFSSSGHQKPPLHLPLWHDLDTMSDSSLWTVLSNFNMPSFFSGARLRRSKR